METGQSTLSGKRIVILGGSSGLGFATAKAAANEGARVVVVSSTQKRIDEALKQLPGTNEGYAVDLSKEQNIKDFFDNIGTFDHLLYTAGENIRLAKVADIDISEAREYFTLRYWGAFTALKYGATHINKGGSICLTSGIASLRPGAGWSLGSSICAAMEGLCRAMAVELAPIRVNVVLPGVIKTNLWDTIPEKEREDFYSSVGNSLLLKRVGQADEIAAAYIFLMKQTFATGQTLVVDGGGVLV